MTELCVLLPWAASLPPAQPGLVPSPRFVGRRRGLSERGDRAEPRAESMLVESQQVGEVEVPVGSLITLPEGLPGFPSARRFCLLKVKPTSRFHLLQSIERADLAFVVIDPIEIEPAYPIDLARSEAGRFGIDPSEPVALGAIVSVPPAPAKMTVNLMAPLIFGEASMRGGQVVLHRAPYRVRHVL